MLHASRGTRVELVSMVFLLLGYLATSTQSPTLAKLNCQERCGNVTIPFPFGIGAESCFLNEWYEIVCKGNGAVPWLKKIDVEVLEIGLPNPYGYGVRRYGSIGVILPIVYSSENCSRSDNRTNCMAPRLDGSPFLYSADWNIFFSIIGCNRLAVINNTGQALSGCRSECGGRNSSVSSDCLGYNGCCETAISSLSLREFSVKFVKEDGSSTGGYEECNYAVLANETWIRPELTDLDGLLKKGYVHGVLDWGISADTDLVAQLSQTCGSSPGGNYPSEMTKSCYRYHVANAPVGITTFTCGRGYIGNPFLINGCQDLDECSDPELNHCPGSCENFYGSFHCSDGSKTVKFGMIGIGAVLGALLLLAILWLLNEKFQNRIEIKRKQKFFKRNGGILLQQQLSSPETNVEKSKLFNSKELEKATDNFNENRILGKGGQGTVYKGMLTDGRIIAVKKSTAVDAGKVEQFINEVLILSQINHRNVVKLLGCCLETEVPLLVYEYIPNGTLYEYLHEPSDEFSVSWDFRLRLATEVAGSLSYLHSAASMPIYHRDIKSSNILLDEKYRAKIADFGTSRSVSLEQTHVTTLVQGTFGYLDPEYFQSSQLTDKSDVYSYGVVLVELLTGQKVNSSLRAQEGMGLASYFIITMEENRLHDILDPQILQHAKREELVEVAKLAQRCLHWSGRKRPTMKEVAMELEELRKPLCPHSNIQQSAELSECMSRDQTSQSSCGVLSSACSEVIARVDSICGVDTLIYGQTW